MADFDPGERRASTLGCATGIGVVVALVLPAVAAVVAAAWWMTAAP